MREEEGRPIPEAAHDPALVNSIMPRGDWSQLLEIANGGLPPIPPLTMEQLQFNRDVNYELGKLRAKEEARRLFNQERQGGDTPFDAGTLSEILGRPEEPVARVQSLVPWEASTLVVAQRKTGKTTLLLNLTKCLLTGEPFLGVLPVRPVAPDASVALLNFEVSAAQLARWASEVGVPSERLFLVNLRGRRNPLTITDDRAALAALLKERRVESILVDPFGRAYSGTSQNDAGEVGSWLVSLDQFAREEVGALDLVLAAHAGWNGERSRGSSALEDWADSIINLTRSESTGDRYIRATGRDVELEEDRLEFDPETRALSLSGSGNRQESQRQDRLSALAIQAMGIIEAEPGLSGREVKQRMVGGKDQDKAASIASLITHGQVRIENGPKGAKLHFPVSSDTCDTQRHPATPGGATPDTHPLWVGVGGVTGGAADGGDQS